MKMMLKGFWEIFHNNWIQNKNIDMFDRQHLKEPCDVNILSARDNCGYISFRSPFCTALYGIIPYKTIYATCNSLSSCMRNTQHQTGRETWHCQNLDDKLFVMKFLRVTGSFCRLGLQLHASSLTSQWPLSDYVLRFIQKSSIHF